MKQAEPSDGAEPVVQAFPRSRILLYGIIALAGCTLDLVTKYWVFYRLGEPNPLHVAEGDGVFWLIEGYFGFQTAVNTGALFGMGKGGSHWFAGLSVIAVLGIVYWLFFRRAAQSRFLTITLGAVTGGILGNLYDRLGLWQNAVPAHDNGVRDWILMQIPGYPPWPNYNIADCLLVCGAAMLVWHAFWYQDPKADSEPKPAAGEA